MSRAAAGSGAGPAPLPAGFRIVFDPQTQFVGADVLFGGSPRGCSGSTRPASVRSASCATGRCAHPRPASWPAGAPTPAWLTPARL